jgi:hypothetical protein
VVLQDGLRLLDEWIDDGQVRIGAQVFGERGRWDSDTFPLLHSVGAVGTISPFLSREYAKVRDVVATFQR